MKFLLARPKFHSSPRSSQRGETATKDAILISPQRLRVAEFGIFLNQEFFTPRPPHLRGEIFFGPIQSTPPLPFFSCGFTTLGPSHLPVAFLSAASMARRVKTRTIARRYSALERTSSMGLTLAAASAAASSTASLSGV